MASCEVSSEGHRCRDRVRGVAKRCRRELVQLILVLGEKRDQTRFDDVVHGEAEEFAHGASFEAVRRQILRLLKRFQKAKESSVRHLAEEG